MKRTILCMFLMVAMLLGMGTGTFAASDEIVIREGWKVIFNGNAKLVNDPANVSLVSALAGLQPGDTMTVSIPLVNQNDKTTDWYMWNRVVDSLEDSANVARNAGYTYRLVYNGPGAASGGDVIFDSETVGGDSSASNRRYGLHEATSGLEDYFYLDTLKNGQQGSVDLTVSLDGETQGNNYQDTLGKLQMRFAVEFSGETDSSTPGKPTTIVRTGDETNMLPYYIAMFVSGLVFLYLALDAVTDRIYGRRGKRGRT